MNVICLITVKNNYYILMHHGTYFSFVEYLNHKSLKFFNQMLYYVIKFIFVQVGNWMELFHHIKCR